MNLSIASSVDPFQSSSETSRATCAKRAYSRRSASLSHSSVGSTGSISVRLRRRCANGEQVAILNAIAPP